MVASQEERRRRMGPSNYLELIPQAPPKPKPAPAPPVKRAPPPAPSATGSVASAAANRPAVAAKPVFGASAPAIQPKPMVRTRQLEPSHTNERRRCRLMQVLRLFLLCLDWELPVDSRLCWPKRRPRMPLRLLQPMEMEMGRPRHLSWPPSLQWLPSQ